jgi:hypothetical protein
MTKPTNKQKQEEERAMTISLRLSKAVPIVIDGCRNPEANGIYEPMQEFHDDWPVYKRREVYDDSEFSSAKDLYLFFVIAEGAWIIKEAVGIKGSGSSFQPSKLLHHPGRRFLRMQCHTETYPELRVEGSNGIEEYPLELRAVREKLGLKPKEETFPTPPNPSSSSAVLPVAPAPPSPTQLMSSHSFREVAMEEFSIMTESEWLGYKEMLSLKQVSANLKHEK